MRQSIMLVDNDVKGDFRLLRAMHNIGLDVQVIDIRKEMERHHPSLLKVAFKVGWLVTQSLFLSVFHHRRLSRLFEHRTPDSILSGLPACIRWLFRSVHAGTVLKGLSSSNPPRSVYAHDLYCAVAAVVTPPTPETRLIYDAHELQIHRHRKTGLLRIVIEHALEQRVLRIASEVRIVNRAIADMMAQLYEMPATVRVEYNDHYTYHPITVPPITDRPALVYVGKGVLGRRLEILDRPATEIGFDVHAYLLGARLPKSISGQYWHHGPEEYEEQLLAVVNSNRSLMWCCLDPTSMSYQLATPNKFFQALAVGIPIIASNDTYLAEIVLKHGIGVVFDGNNLHSTAKQVMSPLYEQWVSSVENFRGMLRSGEVVI